MQGYCKYCLLCRRERCRLERGKRRWRRMGEQGKFSLPPARKKLHWPLCEGQGRRGSGTGKPLRHRHVLNCTVNAHLIVMAFVLCSEVLRTCWSCLVKPPLNGGNYSAVGGIWTTSTHHYLSLVCVSVGQVLKQWNGQIMIIQKQLCIIKESDIIMTVKANTFIKAQFAFTSNYIYLDLLFRR